MTCAGNLFFIRFQSAIFICSRKIRVNDLWMPINSAERTEADFKTRSIKSTAGKNGTVGKREREQAHHSKQKRQRGMNRLAESGVGWGKSTHTSVVKEGGGDWIRQLLNCTSSRGKTPKFRNWSTKWAKNKQRKPKAASQPVWALPVPAGCIHLTSSTSGSGRPRAQHLVRSKLRSQPRKCWSNQMHLCANGSLLRCP